MLRNSRLGKAAVVAHAAGPGSAAPLLASHPLAVVRRRASLPELAKVIPDACGTVWNVVRAQKIPGAGRHVAAEAQGGHCGSPSIGIQPACSNSGVPGATAWGWPSSISC